MENLPGFDQLSQMSDKDLTALFGVRDFFVYELDFAILNNGITASGSFTVQADSSFLWQQGCYFADIAAATMTNDSRVIPSVSCVIQDSGSGRQLMSAAVPLPSIFGTGMEPYTLLTPRFFRAQTQVTVTLANFDAAADYGLKLQFIGTKFYKYAQMGG